MEYSGLLAAVMAGLIVIVVMFYWSLFKDLKTNTNKKDINKKDINKKDINDRSKKDRSKKDTSETRLYYEDYTQAEVQYVQNALSIGCEFDRLYSLQQAGYEPKHIVMYVRLWELRNHTANKCWYVARMNFDDDQILAENQVFDDVWNWCISKGYLIAKYCVPSNNGVSTLMYENKL